MKPLIPLLTYLTCFAYGLEPSPGCGQATEFPQPGDHQWINFIYEDKLLGPYVFKVGTSFRTTPPPVDPNFG